MKKLQPQNPRARIVALGAILLLPLAAWATWHRLTRPPEQDDQFPRILQHYGYFAVTPPSRFFGPGAITTVETLRNGALQLHLACTIDNEALAAKWHKSATLNLSFAAAVRQTFKSSAGALGVAESGTIGESTSGIGVSLQDISIVTMPYDNLIAVRGEYLKGPCEQAILWNLRKGARVCQSEEVLQADIVYEDRSKDGFGGAGKFELAKDAAASAEVGQQTSMAKQAQGDDLFLGVKVQLNHCFELAKNGQDLAGSF
jgi:hypothetical protein